MGKAKALLDGRNSPGPGRTLTIGVCSALMSGDLNMCREGESGHQREMEEKLEILNIAQSNLPPPHEDRVVGKGCSKQKDGGRR